MMSSPAIAALLGLDAALVLLGMVACTALVSFSAPVFVRFFVGDILPMSDVIASSLGRPRFYLSLLGAFAAVAILLAVAGLYGVLSYAVAQRTRELGIRAALGSPRQRLMRLVVLEGLQLTGIGLLFGFAGGAAVTRLMTFMLYGVSPLDLSTWIVAGLLMITATMLATLVPARRASQASPLVAMQAE